MPHHADLLLNGREVIFYSMEKVSVGMEKSFTGYCADTEDYPCFKSGKTIQEVKEVEL